MASIFATGSKGHHEFTLTVTEGSFSQEANTSQISFSFDMDALDSSYKFSSWGSDLTYTITINGTDYSGNLPDFREGTSVAIRSGTQTIAHNENGTKAIDYSFSVTDTSGVTYTPGNASASGKLKLTDIPRDYTVHFDGNGATGGNMDDVVFAYGVESTLPTNGFLRENYTFVGWSLHPKATAIYEDARTVSNLISDSNGVATLYAVWESSLFKASCVNIYSGENYATYHAEIYDGTQWVRFRENIGK